jgi:hypothetical protein
MSADVCMEHQQEDTVENPCRLCTIKSIYELAQSRNGEPEQDEKMLRKIREICEEALGLEDEDDDG